LFRSFEFWILLFVSNFVLRISNLDYVINSQNSLFKLTINLRGAD